MDEWNERRYMGMKISVTCTNRIKFYNLYRLKVQEYLNIRGIYKALIFLQAE